VETAQGLLILSTRATEPEDPAGDDRLIATRRGQFVQRLNQKVGIQTFASRTISAERDHVSGYVAAVDIEPGLKPGK
jgi:hypothetical protein